MTEPAHSAFVASVLVDTHVHLLPDRLSAAIRRYFDQYMFAARYPHEHAAARACLVEAGVTRCWSLPYAHKPGMAAVLNRSMAELFAADPVVVPGATVHPGDDVDAVVREAIDELGLGLVKLHCAVGAFDADDERLVPLWRRVSAGGQPVIVHAGHAVAGTTSAAEIAPLERVARRWPEARMVVAHCGAPAVDATLALLRSRRAVRADLTPVGFALAAVTAADLVGLTDRVLFGSDTPNTGIGIEQGVAHVRGLGLSPAEEAAILGGNATALLGGS